MHADLADGGLMRVMEAALRGRAPGQGPASPHPQPKHLPPHLAEHAAVCAARCWGALTGLLGLMFLKAPGLGQSMLNVGWTVACTLERLFHAFTRIHCHARTCIHTNMPQSMLLEAPGLGPPHAEHQLG